MTNPKQIVAIAPPMRNPLSGRLKLFGLLAAGLTLGFAWPLFGLVRHALESDLHSHALLIPFVAAYLVWRQRNGSLPHPGSSPALAVVPFVFGLAALCALWFARGGASAIVPVDRLALNTFAYLCFIWAGALLVFGGRLLGRFAFPAALLIFIVPMPLAVENVVEVFFQHASAVAASLLFTVTGSTVFQEGLMFRLPGITIWVAQECSGIRSTLVLFITSLLAGQMFLKSPMKRTVLALFIIPLAILRNGLRIFTIGMLCVHIGPDMIDSPIHHRGGPLFFGLSLVPLFLLLLLLRRLERRSGGEGKHTSTR